MQFDVFSMAEHLCINQLLPHLTFQFQCVPLACGFGATGIGFRIVVELDNPVFASFVNTHLLSP
jgi:hypothetical protein